ncbi:arylphorin subunit A4-like [Musca autumnalis]|uniref:arylphorin subunit A4-like n=1 Tax=Musca autumnalis TaxID=221902 RepID=UPI003CEF69D0
MKFIIALCLLAGGLSYSVDANTRVVNKYADNDFLVKQKFLFEIVYRVEDPLMFEEYIKLGKTFTYDKDDYKFSEKPSEYMEKYYEAYKRGVTLPKGEFFGSLVPTHFEQMYGLFEFFYYAKNWNVFQRNVCWGRLHANEGMFVQALTLALNSRDDAQGLMLPAIYEIFPQQFFTSNFIYKAEKFNYDVWNNYIMYEKEYKDFLYKDYSKYFKEFNNYEYFYTKDFKTWQWWKLMGLGENWYSEDHSIMRDNMGKFNNDSKYVDTMKDVKKLYMPVDYTRNVNFINKESALSYFTEDVEWNSFWYYFNMNYFPLLDDKQIDSKNERRAEYFFFVLKQLLARFNWERLSHGFAETPDFSFCNEVENNYDPQLVSYNGIGYSCRNNYNSYGKFDTIYDIVNFFKDIEEVISQDHSKINNGKVNQYRPDKDDIYFRTLWYIYAHRYNVDTASTDVHIHPNIFMNYETMMRDPLYYKIYKKVTDMFMEFYEYNEPYTYNDLYFPGVEIEGVNVTDMVSYFDIYDFDVTNLMNDGMTFVDGKFVWDKMLMGRQMRLNHKDFELEYTIKSDKKEKVVVSAFLGPKFDEYDRVLPLEKNRKNFVQIDEFLYELNSGINTIKRNSKDFYWTTDDRMTYTELYKLVTAAYEGNYEFPLDYVKPHCGFPDRLLLPRGSEKGMPMQLLFFVYPYTGNNGPSFDNNYSCGIGHIDNMPFGYPLDRQIDEYNFFVPNIYFKDVKIIHEDIYEKYYKFPYNNFGNFDYNYYYNY